VTASHVDAVRVLEKFLRDSARLAQKRGMFVSLQGVTNKLHSETMLLSSSRSSAVQAAFITFILWHAHPLLGNDREIIKYKTSAAK
jgi:hypothetical protein